MNCRKCSNVTNYNSTRTKKKPDTLMKPEAGILLCSAYKRYNIYARKRIALHIGAGVFVYQAKNLVFCMVL